MKAKLTKEELLELVYKIMNPKGMSEKEGDDVLYAFCAGCPDPVNAWRLIVSCLDPMTHEELVDRALAMPLRKMADVPASEFPEKHPLRDMTL